MNPERILKEEYSERPAIVGRSRESDICITGKTVSRRHAGLSQDEQGRLRVTDEQSRFGTFVNNHKIVDKIVVTGDLIRFGDATTYRVTEWGLELDKRPRDGVSLSLRDVTISKQEKTLVENVSFDVAGNTFLGILGPSGCGKSILLKNLATYDTPSSGSITYDGSVGEYAESISYVPQDDVVYKHLTVEEHLRYAAKLQIASQDKIDETISGLANDLGLDKHQTKRITKISGGQRKRLSVAMEMMKSPRLLLLDEPTSGLDPATESRLMGQFRQLSQRGATVVCTTHMLSNIDLFDEIVVLGVKNGIGSVAFVGRPNDLLDYFAEKDLVRVYERLEDGEYPNWSSGDSVSQSVSAVVSNATKSDDASSRNQSDSVIERGIENVPQVCSWQSAVPARVQVFETFLVTFRSFFRDRWLLGMSLLQPVMLGLLACISQFNQTNVVPLLFLTVIITLWLGLNNSVRSLVGDRRQYLREYLRGLSVNSYIAAKSVFYILLGGVQILLLGFVMAATLRVAMTGGLSEVVVKAFVSISPLLFLLVLPLTYMAGLGLGFLVSTTSKTEAAAVAALPLLILPQLLISIMAAGMVEDQYEDVADRMRPLAWRAQDKTKEPSEATPLGYVNGTLSLTCYSRPATLALEAAGDFNKKQPSFVVSVECIHLFGLGFVTWLAFYFLFQARLAKWYASDF